MDILKWLTSMKTKQVIKLVLAVLLLLILITMLPGNLLTHQVSAQRGPDPSGPVWIGCRVVRVIQDGDPKSRFSDLDGEPTGLTRDKHEPGPKLSFEELKIKVSELDIDVKVKAGGNIIEHWQEKEYKLIRETWLERPMRAVKVGVIGGLDIDWLCQDDTWQAIIPTSRETEETIKWLRVANSTSYTTDDPPGDAEATKEVLARSGEFIADCSWADNLIPGVPPGTITHQTFLDGISVTDGTTINLSDLELGPHEIVAELYTIDGQTVPLPMPFTLVPPIELLVQGDSEVLIDQTERIKITVKNNYSTPIETDLKVDSIPLGWGVHLCATRVFVPAKGESEFEVMVRPTISAFPEYSMDARVTASATDGYYHAETNLNVQGVFPDDVNIYRSILDGEEAIAFSMPSDTSLSNFRFVDNSVLFESESEQDESAFAIIIPNSLLEGTLQAVGPGGDILPTYQDSLDGYTHQLFYGEAPESGTVTVSTQVSTEVVPPTDISPPTEISPTVSEYLSKKVDELATEIAALKEANLNLERLLWRSWVIVLVVLGLLIGAGVAYFVRRRRSTHDSDIK